MDTDNINANDSETKHGVLKDFEFVEVKTEVISEEELPNEESFLCKSTVEKQCVTNFINFKVKKENIKEELEENCLLDTTFEQGCSSRIKDEYIEEKFSYEEYETPDINKPKTTADCVQDCKARKKLLKQKPPAKTVAQRMREYRARKKALKNSAATITGDTKTTSTRLSGLQDSHTVNADTTQSSTSKEGGNILYNYLSQKSGQPQVLDENLQEKIVVHQENSSQCVINSNLIQIKRDKKSYAQRCQEYRQRKNARENINVIDDVNAIVPRISVVSPVDSNQLLPAKSMEVHCDLHTTLTDLPQQQFRDEFTNNPFGHVCHITLNDGAIVQNNLTPPISIKEEVHEETCVGFGKKCKKEIKEDDAFVGISIAEPSKEINDDGDYKIDIKEMHLCQMNLTKTNIL